LNFLTKIWVWIFWPKFEFEFFWRKFVFLFFNENLSLNILTKIWVWIFWRKLILNFWRKFEFEFFDENLSLIFFKQNLSLKFGYFEDFCTHNFLQDILAEHWSEWMSKIFKMTFLETKKIIKKKHPK